MKIVENISENAVCESCGEEFFCGASVGKCWCFDVELKAETLTELREDFESCLCWNCLVKTSKEKTIYGK